MEKSLIRFYNSQKLLPHSGRAPALSAGDLCLTVIKRKIRDESALCSGYEMLFLL